ncbi:ATP-binding protein [Haloarchaeobius sp. DFWS5]|uniref:sensor histidine kinase n=1 Tax=Haloarchaeobius sp. DFWS5 TaxID=3446114 RepID=UPI003EBED84D
MTLRAGTDATVRVVEPATWLRDELATRLDATVTTESAEQDDRPADCLVCVHDPPTVDALSHLASVSPATSVVFVAVDGDQQLASDAVAAGVDAYVPSSTTAVDPEHVATAVRETIERDHAAAADSTDAPDRDELIRRITETSFDLLFLMDTDGKFEYVSQSVVDTLGLPTDAFDEMHFAELVVARDLDEAFDMFRRVLDGEAVHDVQLTVAGRQHQRLVLELNIAPLVVDGEVEGIHGAARDVTQTQRREEVVQVLNRVLRHNLRNDITAISGYVEALDDVEAADTAAEHGGDEAELYLENIKATAADLAALSEKAHALRQAARWEGSAVVVELAPVVERALSYAQSRQSDGHVVIDVPDDVRVALGDELELALRELCVNALKHGSADEAAVVSATVRQDELLVDLVVEDDGPGLSAHDRTILETGVETPLHHGSGLGLWLVNWITTNAGGTVDVTVANGTTVTLTLPAAPDTA